MLCEGCGKKTEASTGLLVIFFVQSRGSRRERVRRSSSGTWLCGECLRGWAETGQFPAAVLHGRLDAVLARLSATAGDSQGVGHG